MYFVSTVGDSYVFGAKIEETLENAYSIKIFCIYYIKDIKIF